MQKKLIALYDWLKHYKTRIRSPEQLIKYIGITMEYEDNQSCRNRLKDLVRIGLMKKEWSWYKYNVM